MAVEAPTTISGLNVNWPLGSDVKSEGDDHFRMLKTLLQKQFGGGTSADIYVGVKTAPDRFVVNDNADGSGTDVFLTNDAETSSNGPFRTSLAAGRGQASLICTGYIFSGGNYFVPIVQADPNFGFQMTLDCYHQPGVAARMRLVPAASATFEFGSDGGAYKAGGGSWAAVSDARVKTVQGDYVNGLAAVLALHPVIYRYNVPAGHKDEPLPEGVEPLPKVTSRDFIGLIAQEAEIPMPEMVTLTTDVIDGETVTDFRQMDITPLTFALINAVKELAARIAALEAAA